MYSKKTKFYGIPYISKLERMEGKEEEKAAIIIDNMLYAATFGVGKALFEDGKYSLSLQDDGLYELIITPYDGYSFLGILNYALFLSKNTKHIYNLRSGRKYYIYAVYKEDLRTDPENFYLKATTIPFVSNSTISLLLATVDLTGIEGKIDENPEGKEYSNNISAHINDYTNPHGRKIYQDQLEITKELILSGVKVYPSEYMEIELTESTSTKELNFEHSVKFIQTMFLSEPQNIWFEIKNNLVILHSDGKSGIIKLKIDFE